MSDKYSTELINIIKSITKNSCPNSINFHMHSTFSDGSLTAKQIYYQAIELNIDQYVSENICKITFLLWMWLHFLIII